MKLLDREDVKRLKTVFICEKHFEEKYLNRNESQPRLNMSLLPVEIQNDILDFYFSEGDVI